MVPSDGPCPSCGQIAWYEVIDLDSRTVEVTCNGGCGVMQLSYSELADLLHWPQEELPAAWA